MHNTTLKHKRSDNFKTMHIKHFTETVIPSNINLLLSVLIS